MAPRKLDINAAAAALGQRGGLARAKSTTKKQRQAISRAGGLASGGWPKGKKRGPSPLRGRKMVRG